MATSRNVKNEPSSTQQSQMPSQVYDTPFLSSSQRSNVGQSDNRANGGSWLMFGSTEARDQEGKTELDRLWSTIEPQFPNASVSTSASSPVKVNDGKGVVCIHTRDHRDSQDVRMVADRIRDVVGPAGYQKELYYKTYDAKRENLYSAYGDTKISSYKQTNDGSFYQRGGPDREWEGM